MWTATLRPSLIALALIAALAAPAQAAVLEPFTATYSASYGIFSLGQATFELSREDDCWRWHGVADPAGLAALLMGKVVDDSYFCVADNRLQPTRFFHRETGDAEDSYRLVFDWPAGTVSYNGGSEFNVPEGAVDPFLLQLAARRWLAQSEDPSSEPPREFVVVDEDEIKHYRLAVAAGPRITTPAGSFDTVRVARVDDDDEQLVFWAAPALDFLPVRVEHREDGQTRLRLELQAVEKTEKRLI